MRFRFIVSAALLLLIVPLSMAQAPKAEVKPGDPKEETAETADGVVLRCRFYKAVESDATNNSCVILVGDYLADPNAGDWDGLARFLAVDCGLNVIRFDFRGHGQSTKILPQKFWNDQWNQQKVKGYNVKLNKTTIDYKDFKSDYYPMLVNDIAAARNLLDLKNDERRANTRSVYIVASGSSAPLVHLFLASEWNRQQIKPVPLGVAVAIPETVVGNGRRLPNTEVAGKDYAGVVFLSPTRTYNYEYGQTKGKTSVPTQLIKDYVTKYSRDYQGGGELRTNTAMLYLVGDKDDDGVKEANFFFNDVMAAKGKTTPKIEPMKFTMLTLLKSAKEKGVELLGKRNSLKTEDQIQIFIKKIEDDRKRLNPIDRKYEKPFKIILNTFGVNLQ